MTGGAVDGGPVSGATRHVEFLEVLGQGGFGAVYLADVHGGNGFVQRAAIKVLNKEMAAMADIAARQRDEARLLARLQHHAIVRVFDLCELHGRPAVLMEYVEGVDCSVLLRQGALPPRAALQVVATAASALDAAYNHPLDRGSTPLRVVHRDIKPANLLVSQHGGVKVLDFGVARGEFDREGRTESVQFGTARYMAPEQWLYGSVGHGVDLYALGVTLAELLTGQTLGRAPLQPEAFRRHVDAVISGVLQPDWAVETRTGIAHLLAGMLTHDPAERLDAAAVHDLAQGLADGLPGESLPRYARRRVPSLIEARRDKMRQVPLLDATPVSYPERGQTLADPAATPSPGTDGLPSSSGSLALAEKHPSLSSSGRPSPWSSESLAHRAARLAQGGALPAVSLAETVPPPDGTGGSLVPDPPVVPPLASSVESTERMDDRCSTLARQGRRLRARGVQELSERVLLNDFDVDSTAGSPRGVGAPLPARAASPDRGSGEVAPCSVVASAADRTSPDLSFAFRTDGGVSQATGPEQRIPSQVVVPTQVSGKVRASPSAGSASGSRATGDGVSVAARPARTASRSLSDAGSGLSGRGWTSGRRVLAFLVSLLVVLALAAGVWSPDAPAPALSADQVSSVPQDPDSNPPPSLERVPSVPTHPVDDEGGLSSRAVPVQAPLASPSRSPTRAQPAVESATAPPVPDSSAPSSAPIIERSLRPMDAAPPDTLAAADAPAKQSAEEPAPAALLELRVTSIPINAVVFINGEHVGNATPRAVFSVPPGPHRLRLVLGEDAIEQTVSVSALRSNRFTWDRAAGILQIHP